ncbi:MAG TPA: hypothetical protein VGC41_19340 [Kofleriaceae bacterium]
MSGAVCPACGVAVVPGYVKCPKCHRPLPRFARNSISPVGGTTVVEKTSSWPLYAFVGVVVLVIGGYFVRRAFIDYAHAGKRIMMRDAGALVVEDQPSETPDTPQPPAPPIVQPTNAVPVTVHAEEVAIQLGNTLKRQRLWSTVSVVGNHVEVRSSSCADAGMKPAIDNVASQFHAAGLTKLRCLEQSGAVVFARDL